MLKEKLVKMRELACLFSIANIQNSPLCQVFSALWYSRQDYSYSSVFCTRKTVGVTVHTCCWLSLVLHCYITIVSLGLGDMIHVVATVW